MNKKSSYIMLMIVFTFCYVCNAMNMDQAIDRLKVYQFGQDTEMLNYLHDIAIESFFDPSQRQQLNVSLSGILADEKTSYAAKQYACRILSLTASTNEIQPLAKCLLDPKMSHMALYALTHIKDPSVDQVLMEMMNNVDDNVKLGIITTLGNRKCESSIGKLSTLLSSDHHQIASEATKSLGKIGTVTASEAIKAALAEKKNNISILEDAYLSCADHLLVNEDKANAGEIYRQMYKSAQLSTTRGAALIGLASLEDQNAASYIIQALTSDDYHLITIAAQLVQQFPGKDLTKKLCEKLPSLASDIQVLVINALVSRADKSALETLRKATIDSKDLQVRIATIRALGKLGDASDMKRLVEKAAGANALEAQAAQESLYVLSGDDVIEKMISLLDKVYAPEKLVLIRTLTTRNATEAVVKLIDMLDTEEVEIRKASWNALQVSGRAEDIAVLVEKLLSVRQDEQKEAEKAIVAIARRSGKTKESTKLILRKLETAEDIQVRCSLLQVLGDMGDNAALEGLRSGLRDDDPAVREVAVRSLANWPGTEPLDDLLEVSEKSGDHLHRTLALRGYIDMVDKTARYSSDEKIKMYLFAMELSEQIAEQKKVLAAAAKIPTWNAFQMVETHLSNPSLKEEAAMAACKISKNIYVKHGREIKNVLTEIAGYGTTGIISEQARQIITAIDTLQDYILNWEVSGPYVQEGKNCQELFDISFAPEIDKGDKAKWRPMPVGTDRSQPWYLDLLQVLNGGEQRVAYLRTILKSDSDRTTRLLVGSDDGNKIWLNGKLVFANNITRPFTKDQDQVVVNLIKGKNHLLMKITQNNMPWGASVRMQEIKLVEPKLGKSFRLHDINPESRFEAAAIFDVNRDGRLDIYSGGFWYKAPDWKKHFVREVKDDGAYYYDFANLPVDLDSDGWTDILNAAWHNKSVFWIRNPGDSAESFETIIIDEPGNIETAIAVDINGDSKLDLLPNVSPVVWYDYHNDPDSPYNIKWTKHGLPNELSGHGVGAGDINGDGLCDIIAQKGWAEQTQDLEQKWIWHGEFDLGDRPSIPILVHDVDTDNDADIIWGLGHNYGVYWLEQKTDANNNRMWKKHKIDDSWSQPHFLLLADINNDGQKEFITGKRYFAHNGHDPGGHDPLCVYYYEFNLKTKTWQRHLIHEGGQVGFGINTMAEDIDKDGDLDVVAPGKSGLYLFENLFK